MANTLRPIDAFIQYFLDVKPYHTKLLEVIEQYLFQEDINAVVGDKMSSTISLINDPLCKPAGFGVDFDDECGFDTSECCDLFQCVGGFGLIYDNSDLLINVPILAVEATDGIVTVQGDYTYDVKLNIKSIPDNKSIVFAGDVQSYFIVHKLFTVVPKRVFPVITTTTDSFTISGNYVTHFIQHKHFKAYGAGENSGKYDVLTAQYNQTTNQTTVYIEPSIVLTAGLALGNVELHWLSYDQGAYTVNDISYDGISTKVTINETFPVIDTQTNVSYGAVQLRTGLYGPRVINIEGNSADNDGDRAILFSTYDRLNDVTTLNLESVLTDNTGAVGDVKLYGYMFQSGFDGNNECSPPKPYNIAANMSESLLIRIIDLIITPTITPSSTVTPSVTPTMYPTPSLSRSVTPTVTLSPSISPSITPTASATSSITPTPTSSATATPTMTPTITPTPTLTITPTVTAAPNDLTDVFVGSPYVVVGNNGEILTSNDNGVSWNTQSSGVSDRLNKIVKGGGIYVAIGANGTIVTSTDRVVWTHRTTGTSEFLEDIVYDGSQFVVVGSSGIILTSPDGITWTQQTTGSSETFLDIEFNNSLFVVVGTNGSIFTSPDGSTWTSQTSGIAFSTLTASSWNGSLYVVVGSSGIILTSPDGITWTQQVSGVGITLEDVIYDGTQLVIVGVAGTILTSPDGITWTQQTSGISDDLFSILYAGGEYIIIGANGTALRSTNSIAWTSIVTSTSNYLLSVAYDSAVSQFIIVGQAGTIIIETALSVTPTPTRTVTPTISNTPTLTRTPTLTVTPTNTTTASITLTVTPTVAASNTATVTPTNTVTPTVTRTASSTITPTNTRTATVTASPTVTPTSTPTLTPSITITPTITTTNTPTITASPTVTITNTLTPPVTPTSTVTITPTNSATPSITPSVTITDSVIPTPSITPTNSTTPSITPSNSVTPTNTVTATATVTPSITATSSVTPTVTPTNTVTPSITITSTVTPSITQSVSPTAGASPTPTPTVTPTGFPAISSTPTPTVTQTSTPIAGSTVTPTVTTTPTITATPSVTPSVTISVTPSITPTISPTATPTFTPEVTHTNSPTITPTVTPSLSVVAPDMIVALRSLSSGVNTVTMYDVSGSGSNAVFNNISTVPSGFATTYYQDKIAFDASGNYMVVTYGPTCYVYALSGSSYTLLNTFVPSGTATDNAEFNYNGSLLAIAAGTSVYIYYRTGSNTAASYSLATTISISNPIYARFSPDGTMLGVAMNDSGNTYIAKTYSINNNGASTTATLVASLVRPGSGVIGQSCAFNPSNTLFIVGLSGSPYYRAYSVSGSTYTVISISNEPTYNVYDVNFDSTGSYVALASGTSPYIYVYSVSGTTFTKLANPSTLPTLHANGVKFAADNSFVSVAHNSSPYISSYYLSGSGSSTTLTKLTNPSTLPSSDGYSMAIARMNTLPAVTPTPTISTSPTQTPTGTSTRTPTVTPTRTPTVTPTRTVTPSIGASSPSLTSWAFTAGTLDNICGPSGHTSVDYGQHGWAYGYYGSAGSVYLDGHISVNTIKKYWNATNGYCPNLTYFEVSLQGDTTTTMSESRLKSVKFTDNNGISRTLAVGDSTYVFATVDSSSNTVTWVWEPTEQSAFFFNSGATYTVTFEYYP